MGVGPGPQIQVKNNRDNSLNGEGTATVHHAINRASCQLRPPQSCGQQQQPVERAEDAISTDQLVSASHRLGRNEAVDGSQSSWVRDEPHYNMSVKKEPHRGHYSHRASSSSARGSKKNSSGILRSGRPPKTLRAGGSRGLSVATGRPARVNVISSPASIRARSSDR